MRPTKAAAACTTATSTRIRRRTTAGTRSKAGAATTAATMISSRYAGRLYRPCHTNPDTVTDDACTRAGSRRKPTRATATARRPPFADGIIRAAATMTPQPTK
ncbi:hypothetical protein CMMCAS05_06270 [Clavibacter michiganensis subsp. michiganensis]|nr:hypothetical protein CMMCAS05_06270 [Clavibacter michiganensis subsp. michiganensis]